MYKKLLGFFLLVLISVVIVNVQKPLDLNANSKTPLVFGSSMNALLNEDDFVSSSYFAPESNIQGTNFPRLLNWQGTQTMHIMPAGWSILHNSLFLKNKVDISKSEHKGMSTFMEFSLHKGESQWAGDGWSIVLAKDDFRVKQRAGYATGGIDNSLAIRFSTWRPHPINSTGLQVSVSKNGNVTDAALIGDYKNIDVALGTISPGIINYGLLRTYKMWIDLDGETGLLEIRVRFDNSFERPVEPTASYENITMDHLSDQFYAGITASGGGLTMGLFLNHLYMSNQYLSNGIDMTNLDQYLVDKEAPTNPDVSVSRNENGYSFTQTSVDNSGGSIYYEYQLDDAPFIEASLENNIPFGTRKVSVRAFDTIRNTSTDYVIDFVKVTYHDPFLDVLEEQWFPTILPLNLLIPTRAGYQFDGWFSEQSLENEIISLATTIDLNLFPKWTALPYTITFESNGGNQIDAITQGFETLVSEPLEITKLGHTFDGWYSDETLLSPYTFTTIPLGNITVYAKWLVNAYTIRFETNGGTIIENQNIDFMTVVSSLVSPTKLHAFFDGWYFDMALTEAFESFDMPAEEITLYARWIDATPVENLIEIVTGWPSLLDLSHEDSLNEAKSLLASLTLKQDAYVPQSIKDTIARSEIRVFNLNVVKNTEALFEPLPNPATLLDIERVRTIRTAYNDLNSDQKELFNKDLLDRLILAEKRIDDLTVVKALESQFVFSNPITLNDENKAVQLRLDYEALTDDQKALFDQSLLTDIQAVETKLRNLKAVQNLTNLMNGLSVKSNSDVTRVSQARAAYNDLTPEQKALVDDQTLSELTLLESEVVLFVQKVEYRQTSFSILIVHLIAGISIGIAFYMKVKRSEANQ